MAELREAMQARRCPFDPLSVLLGRCAQSLTAAGEVDPEIALSYVLWPTDAMLQAVTGVNDAQKAAKCCSGFTKLLAPLPTSRRRK